MSNVYEILKENVDLTTSGVIGLTSFDVAYIVPHVVLCLINRDCNAGEAIISLGSNSPNYDNIMKDQLVSQSDFGLNDVRFYETKKKILTGEKVYLKTQSTISGGNPPIFTAKLYLLGFEA